MADNGGGHAANGAAENGGYHAAGNGAVGNGGGHALALAVAAAAANGVGPDVVAPAVAAANGAVGNGGHAAHAAAVNGAMENGGSVAPALRFIPDTALYQVLIRAPAAVVARFRATCRRWRDLTSTEAFRYEHHLHRSRCPMPLFFYRLDHQAVPLDDHVRVHLRAVDIHRRESFEVFRFAHLDPALPIVDPRVFRIEGSCDGILLLSYDDRLYACNPCTRHWARLPPLHRLGDIVGFYARDLPCCVREYRVLYHAGGQDNDRSYWILSFPEHAVRHIGRPTNSAAVDLVLAGGICPSFEMPPVMVRGGLHWRPQVLQDNSYLLVFDTAAELFRWMRPPRVLNFDRWIQVEGDQLLEINGMLAMIVVDPITVSVWVLQDYVMQVWVFQYRIELPVGRIIDNLGYDDEGALSAVVFVVSEERNELVQCTHAMLQCDAIATVMQTYQLAANRTILSGYMLQESLLLHAFLPLRPSDAHDGDPPFFQAP